MATSFEADDNPAAQTLLCSRPFDVLRLSPAIYQPDEIRRQYRRLALILHPDKNRHKDAEAAFKKLTAAFEQLIDPTRQAALLAGNTREPGVRGKTCGGNSSGSAGRNASCPGEGTGFRWCREGEYVPEQDDDDTRTPETGRRKERPMKDFLEDFAKQESRFKEKVAVAIERNAERKRAKSEKRAEADQARVDRLRADILGDDAAAGEVLEAKTASWQKFASSPSKRRSRLRGRSSGTTPGGTSTTEAPRKDSRRDNVRPNSDVLPSCVRDRTDGDAPVEGGRVRQDVTRGSGGSKHGVPFTCWVCRRGFKTKKGLEQHDAKSELHAINVQLGDFLSQQGSVL